jgi:hypothetical protein
VSLVCWLIEVDKNQVGQNFSFSKFVLFLILILAFVSLMSMISAGPFQFGANL